MVGVTSLEPFGLPLQLVDEPTAVAFNCGPLAMITVIWLDEQVFASFTTTVCTPANNPVIT